RSCVWCSEDVSETGSGTVVAIGALLLIAPRSTSLFLLCRGNARPQRRFRAATKVLGRDQAASISFLQNAAPLVMASRPFQASEVNRPTSEPWLRSLRDPSTWPTSCGNRLISAS